MTDEVAHEQVDQGNKLGPSPSQNGRKIQLSAGQRPKTNGSVPPCPFSDVASKTGDELDA